MTNPFIDTEGHLGQCPGCGGDVFAGDPHPFADAACGDTDCQTRTEWVEQLSIQGETP